MESIKRTQTEPNRLGLSGRQAVDDPRIAAIRVIPRQGCRRDNRPRDAVAGAGVALGAAPGKTLDAPIEGTPSS